MNIAKKIAICGIISAISIVTMFITAVIPVATYAIPAICGAYLIVILVEIGRKQAMLVYVAVSILSIFLTPDRQAALLYIIIFGYYPIYKSIIEEKFNLVNEIMLKGAVFIVAVAIMFAITGILSGFEAVKAFPIWVYITGALLSILTFISYDYCLTLIIDSYNNKIKKKYLNKFFK